MLVEESFWIAEKIKAILPQEPFPVVNLGSSTLEYRTKSQPFIQKNIFDLFQKEKEQVIHVDLKNAEGIDLAGDLFDPKFRQKLKDLRPKVILCNNLLMYLDFKTRKELAKILQQILGENGWLIITNSHVFPPAHDARDYFYRASPEKIHSELFQNLELLNHEIVENQFTFLKYLTKNPKVFLIKLIRLFLPFYKTSEWWFLLRYYFKNLNKNYSASCLFLQK